MASLYDLDKEMLAVIEIAEQEAVNNDGEISEVTVKALEQAEMAYADKVENVVKYIKNLNAEADAINNEIAILKDKKVRALKKVESLSEYLGACNAVGFSCTAGEVKSRTSKVVKVDPVIALEDKYTRVKTEREPNKIALKEALEAGEVIEGVKLVDSVKVSVK